MTTIAEALTAAVGLHQAGRLEPAAAVYRRILEIVPEHPDALHLLGMAELRLGRPEAGLSLIRTARSLEPSLPGIASNMALAIGVVLEAADRLAAAGRLDEARRLCQRVLDLAAGGEGEGVDALRRLARIERAAGQHHRALAYAVEAARRAPHRPEPLAEANDAFADTLSAAVSLHRAGRYAEAREHYLAVLDAQPDNPDVQTMLGQVESRLGRPEIAAGWFARTLRQGPDWALAPLSVISLARIMVELGRHDQARAWFRRALALNPTDEAAWLGLAQWLPVMTALDVYRRIVRINPASAAAHYNLGYGQWRFSWYHAAAARFRAALVLDPGCSSHYTNLAATLNLMSLGDRAVAAFRRGRILDPRRKVGHSSLLLALNYHPDVDDETLLEEHRIWDRLHGRAAAAAPAVTSDADDAGRPLRVGYVSPDFGQHAVGYFLARMLAAHDPRRHIVHVYSDRAAEDRMTVRLRAHADSWTNTHTLDDGALARRIRDDGIDILIDLAGHTSGNRLGVFAGRAAPVQATWAGYVGTTGLSAIDYLISDPQQSPPEVDRFTVEAIVRLPDGYVTYAAPDYAPPVSALPALTEGRITFGCFNNLAKLNDRVIALWARVIDAVPDARLLIRTVQFNEDAGHEHYARWFARHGIGQDRLVLEGTTPHAELLARYGAVDLALDPFPYTGGLTTLEALWMGVPTVTLGTGRRFCSRHSVSHLTVAGTADFIARDADEYVRIAVGWASDPGRLAARRSVLRARMEASPLCDGARFARHLEAAFRLMWRRHTAGLPPMAIHPDAIRAEASHG